MNPLSAGTLGKAAGAFVLGLVVATVGSVMHRASWPWGLVLCLVLVLVAGVTVRAWGGVVPVVGYAGGLFLAVQVLAQRGPGGDVLVPAADAHGWFWIGGAAAAVAAVALVPRRVFDEAPLPPRTPRRPATLQADSAGAPADGDDAQQADPRP